MSLVQRCKCPSLPSLILLHLSCSSPVLHFPSCPALHLSSPTPLLHHVYPPSRICSLRVYCPTPISFYHVLLSLIGLSRASIIFFSLQINQPYDTRPTPHRFNSHDKSCLSRKLVHTDADGCQKSRIKSGPKFSLGGQGMMVVMGWLVL